MDGPNYGRTVTLTHENLAAMSERQAKQKALKEELDRQIMERRAKEEARGGVDTTGMSKAQRKLIELQEMRQQSRQGGQQGGPSAPMPSKAQPGAYQSHSLPPNFNLSGVNNNAMMMGSMGAQQQQQVGMMMNGSMPYGGGHPYSQGQGGPIPQQQYDSRSLPANYQMMASNGMGQQVGGGGMHTSNGANNGGWMGNVQSPMVTSPTFSNGYQQSQPLGSPRGPMGGLPIGQMPYNNGANSQGMVASPDFGSGYGNHPQQQQQYNQYGQGAPMGSTASVPTFGTAGSPTPHNGLQPSASASAFSAPRQVFTIDDVMGFARKATEEPPMHQEAPMPPQPSSSHGAPVAPKGAPAKVATATAGAKRGTATPKEGLQRGANGVPVTPTGAPRAPSSSQGKDRHMLNKVERLQKELETREAQMQKMMEKNRNWETQAKELQQQLREEKRRHKAAVPARAETAPQPTIPAPAPANKRRLEPIERPSNAGPGKSRPKPAGPQATPVSPAVSPKAVRRNDFNSTLTLEREDQRPITAPDVLDPATQLMRSGHLPPLHRQPQPQPASKQPVGSLDTLKPSGNRPLPLRQTVTPNQGRRPTDEVADDTPLSARNPAGNINVGQRHLTAGAPHNPVPAKTPSKTARQTAAQKAMNNTYNGGGIRATMRGGQMPEMDTDELEDDGGISYMGDAKAVREAEERAMEMMGSKTGFAFHSNRGPSGDYPPQEEEPSFGFSLDHLRWFVTIQLITAQQARRLWSFVADCEADDVPIEHVVPDGYSDAGEEGRDDGYYDGEEEEEEEEQEEGYNGNGEEPVDMSMLSSGGGPPHPLETTSLPPSAGSVRVRHAPVPPSSSASESHYSRRPSAQRCPPSDATMTPPAVSHVVRQRGPSLRETAPPPEEAYDDEGEDACEEGEEVEEGGDGYDDYDEDYEE